jgi:hypothetical protein
MLMPKPISFVLRPLVLTAGFAILALMSGQPSRTSKPGMTAASAAEVVTFDRAVRDFKLPDQIPWSKPSASGTQSANLFGDPSKPGLYVQLLKRPPNNWSHPHFHEYDRYITVLEGTMWIGTGTKFEPQKTIAIRAGGFVRDIAKQPHFDGSGDEGLTIEIFGMGPATSTPAETK